MVPVLDVFLTPLNGLKSQHVMRDTALEFGPPSGNGKLIPLLLDASPSKALVRYMQNLFSSKMKTAGVVSCVVFLRKYIGEGV